MIDLTEKDEKYIFENNYGNITISDKKYFFKLIPDEAIGMEEAVEELAKLVGIKCAHYELININGYSFYLSEDIAGKDEFYPAYELGFFDNSLYEIWHELELRYPNNKEYILNEIIKIYIFDIILLNNDRNYGNYGFKMKDDKIEDVYIIDNELAFTNGEVVLSSKIDINDELNSKVDIKIPYDLDSSINELDYFLQTSSSEYYDMFKKMYDILEPDVVLKTLLKYNVKDIRFKMNIYKDNYRLIGELLNKRGLK